MGERKQKAPRWFIAGRLASVSTLLHQKHLAGALNRPVQSPLVMGRQTRVFAGQDAALVRHELPEQIRVLEIQGIGREINLWLGTWRANFSVR